MSLARGVSVAGNVPVRSFTKVESVKIVEAYCSVDQSGCEVAGSRHRCAVHLVREGAALNRSAQKRDPTLGLSSSVKF